MRVRGCEHGERVGEPARRQQPGPGALSTHAVHMRAREELASMEVMDSLSLCLSAFVLSVFYVKCVCLCVGASSAFSGGCIGWVDWQFPQSF